MKAENVARRLANARSGASLVADREVALPLFKVDCELLVLDTKDVPPIQEFVLRAVDAGLTDIDQIAGLLGLEHGVVLGAAAELLRSEALRMASSAEDRRHRLQLTGK